MTERIITLSVSISVPSKSSIIFFCISELSFQFLDYGFCGKTSRAHRKDYGCRTRYRVTAGIDVFDRRFARFGIDFNRAFFVEFKPCRAVFQNGIRTCAESDDDFVARNVELAPRDGFRTAPSRRVRLPRAIFTQRMPVTFPSAPKISTGFVRRQNSTPSSSAWSISAWRAGISARLLR